MTIGGVYDSLQNSYGMQRIPSVNDEQLLKSAKLDEQPKEVVSPEKSDNLSATATEPEQINKASRVADLENISLKFNKEDSFDYIGNDSSLDNLDMQKAISDMRKDQVLQGYQYFVGSSRNLFTGQTSEDGVVILKNNL